MQHEQLTEPYRQFDWQFLDEESRHQPATVNADTPHPYMGDQEARVVANARELLGKSPTAVEIFAVNQKQHVETWLGPFSDIDVPRSFLPSALYNDFTRTVLIDSRFGTGEDIDLDEPWVTLCVANSMVHEQFHGVQGYRSLMMARPWSLDFQKGMTAVAHREAAAIAAEIQVAWELKENGEPQMWGVMSTPGAGCFLECRDFERAVTLDPSAAHDGQAMRAAHDRAYLEIPDAYFRQEMRKMRDRCHDYDQSLNRPADTIEQLKEIVATMRDVGANDRGVGLVVRALGARGDDDSKLPNHLDLPGYPGPDDPQYDLQLSEVTAPMRKALRGFQLAVYDQKPRGEALKAVDKAYEDVSKDGVKIRRERLSFDSNFDPDTLIKNPLLGPMIPEVRTKIGLVGWRERKLRHRLEAAQDNTQTAKPNVVTPG